MGTMLLDTKKVSQEVMVTRKHGIDEYHKGQEKEVSMPVQNTAEKV